MTNTAENNKRIAKNTLFLYVRMLCTLIINLYTSRVVLNALGANDFGIYNVVGGLVIMFSALSGSISSSIRRFLTIELGTGNIKKLKIVFSSSLTIQFLFSGIIFIIAETIGIWFLNTQMNISESRMTAANWCFQCSVLTLILNLISIPYNAAIVAHEHMATYAYIGILETILKLIIVFFLLISPYDKLIFYSCLLLGIAAFIRLIYGLYCKKKFEECHWSFTFDKQLLRKMLSFSGWNFLGVISSALRDQGVNIVMNIFYGPVVNAARGISMQVNSAINSFVVNFTMALNPQITKNYAAGNIKYMNILIKQGSKLSFYMLLLLSLPILIKTEFILKLWLENVPEYTTQFVRLILIFSMCESLSYPTITAIYANGNIKKHELLVSGIQMLNFPLSYIFLKLGGMPYWTIAIFIFSSICCLIVRLFIAKSLIQIDIKNFLFNVCFRVFIIFVISASIPFLIKDFFPDNFLSFIAFSFIIMIYTLVVIYFIGCNTHERSLANKVIIGFIKKIKAH